MRRSPDSPPAAANIAAVVELERAALAHRSRAERISDTIVRWLGSSVFLVAHVVWFSLRLLGGWVGFQAPEIRPVPFSFRRWSCRSKPSSWRSSCSSARTGCPGWLIIEPISICRSTWLAEQEITTALKLVQEIRARLGAEPVADEGVGAVDSAQRRVGGSMPPSTRGEHPVRNQHLTGHLDGETAETGEH